MASNNPLRVTEDEAEEISQYTCTAPFHKNQEVLVKLLRNIWLWKYNIMPV